MSEPSNKSSNERSLGKVIEELCNTAQVKGEPWDSPHNRRLRDLGDTIVVNEGLLWELMALHIASPVETDEQSVAFWKAEAIAATRIMKAAAKAFPNDDGWLHAAQSFLSAEGLSDETEDARDAARYRWLRTRINWSDAEVGMVTNRTAPPITYKVRNWTHQDVRPVAERPASEHIDEYIDAARSAVNGSVKP